MSVTTLVLGGTRSGKSAFAERLLEAWPEVHVVATLADGDPTMRARVQAHQARRPAGHRVIELEDPRDLPRLLGFDERPMLVDSLGTWLARLDLSGTEELGRLRSELASAAASRQAPLVVVSEEVGLAVHPMTRAGRAFVDELGLVNQAIAAVAARVYLVIAGIPVELAASDGR
jgi:adenosyl cobinamide kinase/adenosyl cobinamide phosphate guanylyltransferase